MKSSRLLITVVLLAYVRAGPINWQSGDESVSCATRCTESQKFRYLPGVSYEHEYQVTTETLMGGANSEKAVIDIRATADIAVISKCDFALRLRHVKLFDTSRGHLTFVDNVGQFRRALERHPLRFSYQDGVVEDICPTGAEEPWVLNIKKGILTMLQNSMNSLDQGQTVKETDVTGHCMTDYRVIDRSWSVTTVKKTKDLMSCTGRHGYQSSVQAVPYGVPSKLQSLPLMQSTHDCEHKLSKDGLITSATCSEYHVFRPFSNQNSGALTHVTQKLELKSRSASVVNDRASFIGKRVDLTFQHGTGFKHGDQQDHLDSKLNRLCVFSEDDIGSDIPRLFSDLVYTVRNVDSTTIRNTLMRVNDRFLCKDNTVRGRKFLLDAIPMAGTSASVQILKELILSKEVTGMEADMWLTSLAFIIHPSVEMLEEVKPLIESPEIKLKAMLPVSTLVNNYCQANYCSNQYAVNNIISSLERNIGYRCHIMDTNFNSALIAIRAIGNAGHLKRISSILSKCFTRSANLMEIRVAAVDGFRRLPCDADKRDVINLYRDVEEDPEMRIGAYLALIECPTQDILNIITNTLESEKVSQVGSFIWSHLTNLKETSSPHKQSVRAILEKEDLKKEFDMHNMKYSRNYEASFFLKRFNIGAMAESNFIWSPKSFIPRAATVNLTVDLFGNSVNLFELGGRIEGLEYMLETYLGPYGYFGDNIAQSREKLGRIKGSMYMRMFGNEISFRHFKGIDSFTKGKNFNFLDALIKMSKDHDYSLTQSIMFLDSSMIIPTSSGLPLNLTVNGTATVDLKAKGKIDLRKVHKSPRSLLVDGTIQPSGAVLFSGAMTIDAFVTKTGIRIVNTWHSSMSVRAKIELDRGKVLSAEIEAPKKNMEILDVTTGFFTIYGNREREQKLITDKRKAVQLCSGKRIAKITGFEVCAEFQYVNASYMENAPYFPFTGPLKFGLTLKNRDTHTVYKLLAKRSESKVATVAQLTFNTPGSTVNRALSLDVSLDYKKKDVDISFVTPWKEALLKGSVTNSRNMKLSGILVTDKTRQYALVSEVAIKNIKNGYSYTPRFELRYPGAQPIEISGKFITEKNRKLNLDLQFQGIRKNPVTLQTTIINTDKETSQKLLVGLAPKERYSIHAGLVHDIKASKNSFRFIPSLIIQTPESTPVSIKGDLDYKDGKSVTGNVTVNIERLPGKFIDVTWNLARRKRKYICDVHIRSKYLTIKAVGNVVEKDEGLTSKVFVDYDLPRHMNIKRKKITLSAKLKNKSTASLHKYLINANMIVKKNPELNFQADIDLSHNRRKHSGLNVQVKYGKNFKDVSNIVTASANLNHAIKNSSASVDYKLSFYHPSQYTNIILGGNHKHDSRSLVSSHGLTNGKNKKIKTELSLKDNSRKLTKLYGSFKISYPGSDVSFDTEFKQPSSNQYKHSMDAKFGKKKASVISIYSRGKGEISHEFKSEIIVPNISLMRIKGTIRLNAKDFKASGDFIYGKKEYGVDTTYKYRAGTQGNLELNIKYPSKRVEIKFMGEKNDSLYSGSINTKLDGRKVMQATGRINIPSVDNIDSSFSLKYPKQSMDFYLRHKKETEFKTEADITWSGGNEIVLDSVLSAKRSVIKMKSPFKPFDDIEAELTNIGNKKMYGVESRLSWSGKRKIITASVNVAKPISARSMALTMTAKTPFNKMRRLNFGIVHNLDNRLKTELKASVDKTTAEVIVSGENRGTSSKRDLDGFFSFKSSIPKFRLFEIQVKHADDWTDYDTEVTVGINEEKYVYDLELHHQIQGLNIINNGKLKLKAGRYYRIDNSWQHRNTDKDIKIVINSNWGNGNKILFDLSGSHEIFARTKSTIVLKLETPWAPLNAVNTILNNEIGTGYVAHQGTFVLNGESKMSTNLNYFMSPDKIEADILLTTPWTDDISGTLKTQRHGNDLTGHAQFQLSPYKKVIADGTLTSVSLTNIDGHLRLKTPFDGFNNILITAKQKRERQELNTRVGVEYGNRKEINFESRIQLDKNMLFFARLETSFTGYRKIQTGFQFIGSLQDFDTKAEFTATPLGTYQGVLSWHYISDLQAKLRIDTSHESFPYFQLDIKNEKIKRNNHFVAEIQYSSEQIISIESTYNFRDAIKIETTVKTPFKYAKYMSASLKHTLGNHEIQTKIRVQFDSYDPTQFNLKMKWLNQSVNCYIYVQTPIEYFKSSQLVIRHDGYNSGGESSAHLTIQRKKFNETVVDIFHHGNLKNLNCSFSVLYGNSQKISGMWDNKLSHKMLKSTAVITTPFMKNTDITIEMKGELKNFTSQVTGSYGDIFKISNDMVFAFTDQIIKCSSIINYKFNNYSKNAGFIFHKEDSGLIWKANLDGNVDDKTFSIVTNFVHSENVEGSLKMRTPFDSFRDVGLSFGHQVVKNTLKSDGGITYMDGKTLQGTSRITSSTLRNFKGKFTAITPFDGYREMSIEHKHRLRNTEWSVDSKVAIENSQKINANIYITVEESKTEIKITANTNVTSARKVSIMMKQSGGINDFTGVYTFMIDDKTYKADIKHRIFAGNIDTQIRATAPYIENIDIDFQHSRNSKGFLTTATTLVGTDIKATIRLTQTRDNELYSLITEAEYKNGRDVNKANFNIEKSGTFSNGLVKMVGNLNSERVAFHISFQPGKAVHGEISITTSYETYRNLGLTFDYSGLINHFSFKGTLQHMENKKLSLILNHSHDSWKRTDNKAKIKMPYNGYEKITIVYSHLLDSESVSSDIIIQYGEGNEISGKIQASLIPSPHFDITMGTPFEGFRTWIVKGQLGEIMKRYEAFVKVTNDENKTASLHISLDLSGSPYTASLKIQTPIKDFEIFDLALTYRGRLTDFASSAVLKTCFTDTVRGKASLRYGSLYDMEGEVSLTSNIDNMKNMKLAAKTDSNNQLEKKSHVELSWAPREQITIVTSYRQYSDWLAEILTVSIDVTTPFEIAKHEFFKYEQHIGDSKYGLNFEMGHNDKVILDMDTEYSKDSNYRHMGSVIIRKPRQMEYTASGLVVGRRVDCDLTLNWHKNEPNSNVHFETAYGSGEGSLNKDFKFKLIHLARTMGFVGSIKNTPRQTRSYAEVSWNEDAGSKLSYDFSLKSKTRRFMTQYDSMFKVGFPGRSLQVSGSYGCDHRDRTLEGTFLWDVDKDKTKAIEMKFTFRPFGRRADVTFRLPSIGKDIRLGTRMSFNKGSTIFSGKTEVSYTQDKRKTITLLSRLEDISSGYGKNYTFTFGMTHPITDLDCKFSMSVGHTSNRYFAGMDISYKTARRENKNLALHAEINRLRNLIKLEIVNPQRKFEVYGEVVSTSPLQLQIRNRNAGEMIISSDLTIDWEDKTINFLSNYDTEKPENAIRIYARYVNSSTYQADLFHMTDNQEHRDRLLAFRLKTSHILHTHLHWSPDTLNEFQTYLVHKFNRFGEDFQTGIQEATTAIGNEIEARYHRTVNHLNDEMEPVGEMIKKEMIIVRKQLEVIRRGLQRMYNRNDLHIHDMGKYILTIINAFITMVDRYTELYNNTDREISKLGKSIKSYPIRQKFYSVMNEFINEIQGVSTRTADSVSKWISNFDEQLQNIRNSMEQHIGVSVEYMEYIKRHPIIKNLDYDHYISVLTNKLFNRLKSTNLANQYTFVIYNVHDIVSSCLADIISKEEIDHLHSLTNSVYEESKWAYNYWEVEKNTRKHLTNILRLIKEIVQEEFEKYTPILQFFIKSRFTVYEPEHGEIQMETHLPLPLKSLDIDPNMVGLVKQIYGRYAPHIETMKQYYYTVSSMRTENRNKTDDTDNILQQIMNSNIPLYHIHHRMKS